jgi:PmbA protein
MDTTEFSKKLVKKCLDQGADEAEVYIQSMRNLNLRLRNGAVETVQESASKGVGFRVFVKSSLGFSSSNDLSEKALDKAISSAIRFARITTADSNNVLPDDPAMTPVEGIYDPALSDVPVEDGIRLAKTVEEKAMAQAGITKSAGATYGQGGGEVYLSNSHGLAKSYKQSVCGFGVAVVAEKGDQRSTGNDFCQRRFYADLKKPEEVAAKAALEALEMLDPKMVKTQRAAVLFHPDVGGTLLGGILAAVNGERVLQGASFLARSLGQKIGSELLTVIDDGTRPKGLASRPFDGEGVPTRKQAVVEKGVLKTFLYNARTAKRAGVESTGNASRGGFTGLPDIGANNFFLAAGATPPEEIIRATRRGILRKEVTGYGINPVTGYFSGGASGLWIEEGKVVFPVKGLTVAGTAQEIFNGLDLLGNDLKLDQAFATPTFRIVSLQIGGE